MAPGFRRCISYEKNGGIFQPATLVLPEGICLCVSLLAWLIDCLFVYLLACLLASNVVSAVCVFLHAKFGISWVPQSSISWSLEVWLTSSSCPKHNKQRYQMVDNFFAGKNGFVRRCKPQPLKKTLRNDHPRMGIEKVMFWIPVDLRKNSSIVVP